MRTATNRRWKTLVLLATVGIVLMLIASLVPFVRPPNDEPPHADAVVILSGDHGERFPRAVRLLERGVASTLVFNGTIDRAEHDQLCREGWRGREVVCLRPQPDSTRHEARAAARLAKERGWKRLVVVTSTYHVPRTALLFHRCVDGDVWVVGEHPDLPLKNVWQGTLREWLATGYFLLFKRSC